MVTITLPPELEQVVTEQAQQQGTTPELLALERLHQQFLSDPIMPVSLETGTMADFLSEFIGCIDSREIVPGGANLSEDPGQKFTELLLKPDGSISGGSRRPM